jgi:hypothetical protein
MSYRAGIGMKYRAGSGVRSAVNNDGDPVLKCAEHPEAGERLEPAGPPAIRTGGAR